MDSKISLARLRFALNEPKFGESIKSLRKDVIIQMADKAVESNMLVVSPALHPRGFLKSSRKTRFAEATEGRKKDYSELELSAVIGMGVMSSIGVPSVGVKSADIVNICDAISSSQDQEDSQECGYIVDDSKVSSPRFRVHPLQMHSSERWTVVSSKDILEDEEKKLPPLRYRHKIKLSSLLALSILKISQSPWMSEMLTSKDVFLVRRDDATIYESAYVARNLPELSMAPPVECDTNPSQLIPNRALFSLGIILIEIVLGTSWDKLRGFSEGQKELAQGLNWEADWLTANDVLDRVSIKGGLNYVNSVQACINCEFLSPDPDLGDDAFRQEVYDKVVAPLQEGLEPL